jgi:ferredoxin
MLDDLGVLMDGAQQQLHSRAEPSLTFAAIGAGQLALLAEAAASIAGPGAVVVAPEAHEAGVWTWEPMTIAGLRAEAWTAMVNTDISPKRFLLPQTEEIFAWQTIDRQPAIVVPPPGQSGQPIVLFGVRPCDAAALAVLDQALLAGEWPDETYRARRNAALVITWACAQPGPECLCDATGLSPAHEAGDVMVVPEPDRDRLLLRGLTVRGRQVVDLTMEMAGVAPSGSDDDPAARPARYAVVLGQLQAATTVIGRRVDLTQLPAASAAANLALFNNPAWPVLGARCVSCGTCAYVCPTCHCFAVTDEPSYTSGRRVRTWDSCQFKEFMAAAGGHNPRPTKTERARQRFMHKLGYHQERHGVLMCVGCGRCVRACPVGLHIAEVCAVLSNSLATSQAPPRIGAGEEETPV